LVDNVRVRSIGKSKTVTAIPIPKGEIGESPKVLINTEVFFVTEGNLTKKLETPVYDLENLKANMKINGPAIILN